MHPLEMYERITEWRASFEWKVVQTGGPAFACWHQQEREEKARVRLVHSEISDPFYIAPTLISGEGGRLVFAAPFCVSGIGNVPDALLVGEARVEDVKMVEACMAQWAGPVLEHSQAVARRLMCISRSNRCEEVPVTRLEECGHLNQLTDALIKAGGCGSDLTEQRFWYGLKSFALNLQGCEIRLADGRTIGEFWRELVLQHSPAKFESLFPEGWEALKGHGYYGNNA